MTKRNIYTFWLVLLLSSFLFGYWQYFSKQPFSIHAWRQTDCVSMTQNYYTEHLPFLEPKIHAQISIEGRGVAEFPFFYYVSAKLWTLFGKHVFWNRLLNVSFVFLGLYFLYKLAFRILNHVLASVLILVLFFASPLVAYYTNNFMSNMPALASVFIGWYFLYDYYYSGQKWTLMWAFLALVFGTLLRSTMIIGYFAIYLVLLIEFIGLKQFGVNKTPFFRHKWFSLGLAIFSLGIITAWYSYVKDYNASYQSTYFLTTIRPIWESDKIHLVLSNLFWEHLYQVQSMFILTLFLIMLVLNIIRWKQRISLVNLALFSTFIGLVFYIILWFNNFFEHDYYLLDVWLFLIPNLLVFIYEFLKSNFFIQNQKIIRYFLFIAMILSVLRTSLYQSIKLDYNGPFKSFYVVLPRKFLEYTSWWQWYYDTRFQPLVDITPYLRNLGIQRDDMVFSLPDNSPNMSLYLMDQKGLSYFVCDPNKPLNITLQEWIKNGKSKYLIISDEEWINKPELKMFLAYKIGQWKQVHIYKL